MCNDKYVIPVVIAVKVTKMQTLFSIEHDIFILMQYIYMQYILDFI